MSVGARGQLVYVADEPPVRLFGGHDSRLRVWHFEPAPDG
jgi:hypothetical protein